MKFMENKFCYSLLYLIIFDKLCINRSQSTAHLNEVTDLKLQLLTRVKENTALRLEMEVYVDVLFSQLL
jgi:regulator of replication initiation timing